MALDVQDEMDPIRGFVSKMAEAFPETSNQQDFQHINLVLTAKDSSPHEVQTAIDALKNEASAERYVLASFKALQQGKKLMSMAEEFIKSKTHLVKVIGDLDSISNKCNTQTMAMSSLSIDQGIKALHGECSLLRTVSSQVSADDVAGTKALHAAKDAVSALATALLKRHITLEGNQYLETQCATLTASRVMSRPPSFSVLNVNDIVEKTVGSRVTGFDDLKSFYHSMGAVAEATDALLRVAPDLDDSKQKMQSISVQLCQSFQGLKSELVKVNCSCREMNDAATKLQTCLEDLVGQASVKVWEAAMSQPVAVLVDLVKKETTDKAALEKAIGCIPDAKLLATGTQCHELKAELQLATWATEILMNVKYYAQTTPAAFHAKAVRKLCDLMIGFDALPKDSVLNAGTSNAVDVEKLKNLVTAFVVWFMYDSKFKILFGYWHWHWYSVWLILFVILIHELYIFNIFIFKYININILIIVFI